MVVAVVDVGLSMDIEIINQDASFESNDKLTEILDRGAVVGTADYIAPEQAMNHPDLDIRADIYSLGATFFHLVTGRPPFDGNTTQKLLQHQMKEAPTLASIDKTFPPGLSEVVTRMLAKKPADRYATPADVISALSPWLPASSQVLAAISQTDLRRSPALQSTLNEVVRATTKRLNRVKPFKTRVPVYAAAAVAVVGRCINHIMYGNGCW